MQWIKSFKGHSGCNVDLFKDNNEYIVIKQGNNNLEESAKILNDLHQLGFNTPKTKVVSKDKIVIEYINGIDMQTYLAKSDSSDNLKLLNFINEYYSKLYSNKQKDFSVELKKKLDEISIKVDYTRLHFNKDDLYNKLPKNVSVGTVHGDFTLENILFKNDKFYLIDANPTPINSLEYDGCKILQDLDSLWFVRKQNLKNNYAISCNYISNQLKHKWQFLQDKYVIMFMLMRIIPYCTEKETEDFLYKEINKLWQ